jgi:hypothetical protein
VGGHLLDPVALVLRAGSELITAPFLPPLFPGVTGIGQGGPEADGGIPVSTVDSVWFRHGHCWPASPGSPPRAAQAGQEAQKPGRGMCPSEQRVPHRSASLPEPPPTGSREGKHGRCPADAHAAHRGLPRYRAGQGPLPGESTAVECPFYQPNGDRGPLPPETHLFGNT